jgi:hypothetical protein
VDAESLRNGLPESAPWIASKRTVSEHMQRGKLAEEDFAKSI